MKWDILVIDEGHRAKNVKTQLRKALKEMKVEVQKIVLTGTPVQNNLNEFWSIIDLVQDDIFGNLNQFKEKFANPISKGLQKHAKFSVKRKAVELIAEMKSKYTPFFKRRMKREIFQTISSELTDR